MSGVSLLRYLPPDDRTQDWGWNLLDAGRQDCPAGAKYPPIDHPRTYLFDKRGGRILDEYQIVLVTEGSGWFESKDMSRTFIEAGTAMLLFPGCWHRYHPSLAQGWSERWIGFRGAEADRLVDRFFSPTKPVFTSFDAPGLLRHLEALIDQLQSPLAGREQILASYVPMALAYLQAPPHTPHGSITDEALTAEVKVALAQDATTQVDLPMLAKRLGVSYSRLRLTFRAQTGYSPREYENLCRLNRACELLRLGQENVTEVATRLGYSSPYYFSRAFKKQFGLAPRHWKGLRLPQ